MKFFNNKKFKCFIPTTTSRIMFQKKEKNENIKYLKFFYVYLKINIIPSFFLGFLSCTFSNIVCSLIKENCWKTKMKILAIWKKSNTMVCIVLFLIIVKNEEGVKNLKFLIKDCSNFRNKETLQQCFIYLADIIFGKPQIYI